MSELEPDAQALFAAARQALEPPDGAATRVLTGVTATAGISAASLLATSSASSKPAAALMAKLSAAAVQLLSLGHAAPIATLLVGGSLALGVVVTREHPAPRAALTSASQSRAQPAIPRALTPVSPTRVSPTPVSPTPELSSARVGTEGPANPEPPVLSMKMSPARVVKTAQPRLAEALDSAEQQSAPRPADAPLITPAPTRDTEVSLVARMQAAWRAADWVTLGQVIQLHQQRYPSGVLTEEREAMRAILRCSQDPAHAANTAQRFMLRFSASAYEARVRAACH